LSLHLCNATHDSEVCALGAEVLLHNQLDVPAALLYLPQPDRKTLSVVQSIRFPRAAEQLVNAPDGELSRTIRAVSTSGEPRLVQLSAELRELLPETVCNGCVLGKPRQALLLPLGSAGTAYGVLLIALHPGSALDEPYKAFLNLLASRFT